MAIAIDCFARYGYQGTSTERIASAAGVTKGALYYHFRDKEELLFEAVKDRIAEFEERIVGTVTPANDPAAAHRCGTSMVARSAAHLIRLAVGPPVAHRVSHAIEHGQRGSGDQVGRGGRARARMRPGGRHRLGGGSGCRPGRTG